MLVGTTIGVTNAPGAARVRSVTYTSECSCEDDHGVARWRAKTDRSEPPNNPADIQPVVPSDIFGWEGPGIIPRGGGRTGNELRWFALTGRVVSMGAENDGDVHLVLVDAADDKPGKVVVEMPLGTRWCAVRTTAFSWTDAVFPFTADWQHTPFRLVQRPVVTVIGKAFYDTDHSGKDVRNNRRPREKEKAVWEIHPVMKMEVVNAGAPPTAPPPSPTTPPPISTAIAPTQTPALASPTTNQLVTITQPVRVKIAYGETILQPGTKLPLVSRDATTVRVQFMGETQILPISATDLR